MKLWLYYLCAFFGIILLRYFLVAGGAYWLFYASNHSPIEQPENKNIISPNRKAIARDITLSAIATVALAMCAALIMTIYDSGATHLYSSIDDYGIVYLAAIAIRNQI